MPGDCDQCTPNAVVIEAELVCFCKSQRNQFELDASEGMSGVATARLVIETDDARPETNPLSVSVRFSCAIFLQNRTLRL